jgi:photosystem II stability/assembly factor-like uncharacterized protein
VGWLNEFGSTPAGPSVIYKTSDGGKHWQEQLRWDGPGAQQMVFMGNDGVVVGQGGVPLYRTTDGGSHWQRLALPAMLSADSASSLYFRNPNEGWLLGYLQQTYSGSVCAPGGCPLVGLFHTTDGGQSWTETASMKPMEMFPGGRLPEELHFTDALNGWLVSQGTSNPPILYVTHDGGKSWNRVSLRVPPSSSDEAIVVNAPPHFFSNTAGVLILQTAPLCQGANCPTRQSPPEAYLYRTSDGGRTWSAPSTLPLGGFGFGSVFFLDASHYWIAAGSSLAVTNDGGQHWTIHQNIVPGNLYLAQLQFISPRAGWLIATAAQGSGGRQVLYATTDGGDHWQPLATPNLQPTP